MRRLAALLLLAVASSVRAQDVILEIKGDVEVVKVTRLVPVTEDREVVKKFPFDVLAPKDADGYWWSVPPGVVANDRGDTLEITSAPNGELTVKIKVQTISFDIDFEKKTVKKKTVFTFGARTLNIGTIVPPPPIPPIPPIPPDPKPPLPPQPVTSFRVIFVAESGKTLTAQQNSAIAGKAVRDWLAVNTTPEGGFMGYRHFDPQQTVANEPPNMKRLWEAVQPKLTALPCVVVEVNGLAEIIPLAATAEAQVDVFKKYKGGA